MLTKHGAERTAPASFLALAPGWFYLTPSCEDSNPVPIRHPQRKFPPTLLQNQNLRPGVRGVCVGGVLWMEAKAVLGDRACLPSWSLRPILSWAWGEVFPADKQLMSPDSQLEPTAASNCGGASWG